MEALASAPRGDCRLAFLRPARDANHPAPTGLVAETPVTVLVEQAIALLLKPGADGGVRVFAVAEATADAAGQHWVMWPMNGTAPVLYLPLRELPDAADREAILLLAVHQVARLVAGAAPPRSRDSLWLATCVVAVTMLDRTAHGQHRPATEGFLRVWTRAMLGQTGDPPPWNDTNAALVLARDPWAGAFMAGLAAAVDSMTLPTGPTSLHALTQAARRLAGDAMLRSAEPMGCC